MPIIYWARRGSLIKFEYEQEGYVMNYMYYTFKEAYRRFKQYCNINRAHLVEIPALIHCL